MDTRLAGSENKAAAAAKAGKTAVQELEDPRAWRERWAPTDAVSRSADERRLRYRIRIGAAPQPTEQPQAQSGTGWRQFAFVLVTTFVLVLAAVAGPSLLRASERFVRYVNAQFSAPPPPDVPAPPARHDAPPRAPQVPDGPY